MCYCPFENETLITEEILDKVLDRVKGTTNCHIILMICSMAVTLGCADNYAYWVFEKSVHIHDYYENGVSHAVYDNDLRRFYRSLILPSNIVKVIGTLMPKSSYEYDRYDFENKKSLISDLLYSLIHYNDKAVISGVIDILDMTSMERWEAKDMEPFKIYFSSQSETDVLFDERLNYLIDLEHTGKWRDNF